MPAEPTTEPEENENNFHDEEIILIENDESHPIITKIKELIRQSDASAHWEETEEWSKFDAGTQQLSRTRPNIPLHSLIELKKIILNGIVALDVNASTLQQIVDYVSLDPKVRDVLLTGHAKIKLDTISNQSSDQIPNEAEANNILIAEVDFVGKTLSAFIRLQPAVVLHEFTEIPTRFLVIFLGPVKSKRNHYEVGRALGLLLSDDVFLEVAFKAKTPEDLLTGINEFSDAIRIQVESVQLISPSSTDAAQIVLIENQSAVSTEPNRIENSRNGPSGKPFGGLINDFRQKRQFYLSEFRDGFVLQCIASTLFIYLASLAGIIMYAVLSSQLTNNNIAGSESLLAGLLCGVIYALFAGQPLTILGPSGPILLFESVIYNLCQYANWDYLSFRFWIGAWIGLFLLVLAIWEASYIVCFVSRFTKEIFIAFFAVIFASEAIIKAFQRNDFIMLDNDNRTIETIGASKPEYERNNSLISVTLFLATIAITLTLKLLKRASFLPLIVWQSLSNFAVVIAIVLISLLDFTMNLPTNHMQVPHRFETSTAGRTWLISPFQGNSKWSIVLALIPAWFGTICIFLLQNTTSVIVNRSDNKLKKECGYNLDLLVVAILISICSVFGLPWFVASMITSLNHVNSLSMETLTSCGKLKFLGIREQRITAVSIAILIGFSVILAPILNHLPMPVFYGVFLYMGLASLQRVQFLDRILLIVPSKLHSDEMFREISSYRINLFTTIQLGCLVLLAFVKSASSTSILSPLMLFAIIGIRKFLNWIFTKQELKILDNE